MTLVMPAMAAADTIVLATPLYVDGMTGPMKTLLDRMVPAIDWKFDIRDGHCRHPIREKYTDDGKLVLISNSGFWELDNFDPLVTHVEAICKNMARGFVGALLRPHGPALSAMIKRGIGGGEVVEALRDAGRQLVVEGNIEPETITAIARELVPMQQYVELANMRFQKLSEKHKQDKE